MTPQDDAAVDQAIATLDQHPLVVAPSDNVYPWWKTLRLPLTLGTVALLLSSVAGCFLAVSEWRDSRADQVDDKRSECLQRHTDRLYGAAVLTRRTSAYVDNLFGLGLLVTVYDDDPELAGVDVARPGPQAILDAIEENDAALKVDRDAQLAYEAWVAAGQPLPCPIQNTSTAITVTTEE